MNVAEPHKSVTNTVVADRGSAFSGMSRSGHADQRLNMQQLSLDTAVSPLLPRATAPFDKTERKRAHTSAVYYSECFLRGIKPLDADSAAKDAQEQYDKWWINRTARNEKRRREPLPDNDRSYNSSSPKGDVNYEFNEIEAKRRRISMDEASTTSANVVSVASGGTGPASKKSAGSGGDGDDDQCLSIRQISILDSNRRGEVTIAKARLIEDLKSSGGDVETIEFVQCMAVLEAYYKSKSWDGRGSCKFTPFSLEGNWLTLSKPTYDECKGRNDKGELLYTLGRMSFGMFRPEDLNCSVQASFNNVRTIDPKNPGRPLHVPKKLMKEIESGSILLRTYDIVAAITIQPGQDRRGMKTQEEGNYIVPKPIKGILTNQGYAVPDPNVPNRLSIWFSGGALEVQDEPSDLEEWMKVFDSACAPERNVREYANILAARVLLGALVPEGMEEDGSMSYDLKKPIGGHGTAYCDIVYMDDDLRIMRGHHGSVYVCSRVPEPQHVFV